MPGRRRRRAQLDALRNRVTSNLYATSERWDARRRTTTLSAQPPWLGTDRELTISLAVWFAALSWQLAYEFLEGCVVEDELPSAAATELDRMLPLADSWTDFAVRMQSQLADVPVPALTVVPWQAPRVGPETAAGVWRMADEIAGRVDHNWSEIAATLPKRFAAIERTVQAVLQPNQQLVGYLREQMLLATDPVTIANIAQRALVPAGELFQLGQRLQAPYLFGTVFTTARSRAPSLDDLDLGFDPWLLTDAGTASTRRGDPASEAQLLAFWQGLANPGAARQLAGRISDALHRRRLRYRTSRGYPNAPWPPQWMVRFPVTFDRRTYLPGDLISLFIPDAPSGQRTVEVGKSGRLLRRRELLGF